MIKDFTMKDLGYFVPNEHSNPDNVLDQLCSPEFVVLSLWHDGMVQAILVFKNYWGDCWHGFFLIAEGFPIKCAIFLKRFVHATMEKLNASRLQTDSVACDVLNKWHEWLGFELEGCKEKMMFGRDYNMWALMRSGGA